MKPQPTKKQLFRELDALRQEIAELRAMQTTHGQSQEGLYAIELQLAGIVHSAMDAIITTDEEQNIVLFNSAAERMFGHPADKAIGQSIDLFIPARFHEAHRRHIRSFGERDVTNRRMDALGQVFGIRSNGEEFPIEASISKVDTGGKKLFTVILRDIGERKRAEEAFQRLKRQDELLLNAAGEGIYGLDLQGNTTFVNPIAAKMLGWEPHELKGQSLHTLIHHTKSDGTSYPMQECPIYSAFKDGNVHHVENEVFWRKDGSSFSVDYTSTPIIEDGKIMGAVVTFKDIAERRRLQEHLRRTERLAEMGTLAAGMAHEIGTPMNVILGRAEYLMRKTSDESTKKGLATITIQVERITKIMNQLLSFARRRPLERRPLDLTTVVCEILEVVQERIELRHIQLEKTTEATLPKVFADQDQMGQMLLNLILNAIHVMPNGGTLRVGLVSKGDHVQLSIADTGCGIPKENIPKLFTPFFTTKEVGDGTGLGLTVVHGIVQEHEGTIFVDSTPEEGSTFFISLPMCASPQTAGQPPS